MLKLGGALMNYSKCDYLYSKTFSKMCRFSPVSLRAQPYIYIQTRKKQIRDNIFGIRLTIRHTTLAMQHAVCEHII